MRDIAGFNKLWVKLSLLIFSIAILCFSSYIFFSSRGGILEGEVGSKYMFYTKNSLFEALFNAPNKQDTELLSFRVKGSSQNPFSGKQESFFTKVRSIFVPDKKQGLVMTLADVGFGETMIPGDLQIVNTSKGVSELFVNESDTKLIDSGVGKQEGSSKAVLNKNVVDGVDIQYSLIDGYGIKEDIIINNLDGYTNDCLQDIDTCKIPPNEFVFNISLDEGLSFKEGWYYVGGVGSKTYYIEDSKGRYYGHFLPSFATDANGILTYKVTVTVESREGDNYEMRVILDSEWLLSSERVFPVVIDPSIIHDSKNKFDLGQYYQTTATSKAGIGLITKDNYKVDENTLSYISFDGSDFGYTEENNIDPIVGRDGSGGEFDSSKSNISLLKLKDFPFDMSFSLSYWYLGKEGGEYGYVKNEKQFRVVMDSVLDGVSSVISDRSGNSVSFSTKNLGIYDEEWHHIYLYYEEGNYKIVIDGVEKEVEVAINGELNLSWEDEDIFKFGYIGGVVDTIIVQKEDFSLGRINSNIKNRRFFSYGEYISPILDLDGEYEEGVFSYISSGKSVGSRDYLYSSKDLVGFWRFADLKSSEGQCREGCQISVRGDYTVKNGVLGLASGSVTLNGVAEYWGDQNTLSLWVKDVEGDLLRSSLLNIRIQKEILYINGSPMGGVYANGKWNNIVLLASPGGSEVYFNGVSVWDSKESLSVNSVSNIGYELSGSIDSVSLFSRVLSYFEILSNSLRTDIKIKYRTGGSEDILSKGWIDLEKTEYQGVEITNYQEGSLTKSKIGDEYIFNPIESGASSLYFEIMYSDENRVTPLQCNDSTIELENKFSAKLNPNNGVDGVNDMDFVLREKDSVPSYPLNSLFVGDTVVVYEAIGMEKYLAQGIVGDVESESGQVFVTSWDPGSTFPTNGFSKDSKIFKWEKVLMEEEPCNYGMAVTREQELLGLRGLEYRRYLENTEEEKKVSLNGSRYFQYMLIFNSDIENVTPYISNVKIDIVDSNTPSSNQLMRHGKWFDNGKQQNYWWVNN